MVTKMFEIHGVKITGKYICESKNWIWLLMHLKQNSSVGFYHNHSRQKEITNFPQTK